MKESSNCLMLIYLYEESLKDFSPGETLVDDTFKTKAQRHC